MAITTTYNPEKSITTSTDIMFEWFDTYYPISDYLVTFDAVNLDADWEKDTIIQFMAMPVPPFIKTHAVKNRTLKRVFIEKQEYNIAVMTKTPTGLYTIRDSLEYKFQTNSHELHEAKLFNPSLRSRGDSNFLIGEQTIYRHIYNLTFDIEVY